MASVSASAPSSTSIPSSTSKTMRKNAPGARTDVGWEYGVDMGERKVKCKFCDAINTGGIYRFKHHLARSRYNCGPCPKVPEDIQIKFQKNLEETKKKREKGSDYVLVDEVEDGSEFHSDRELEAFNIPMSTSSVASVSASASASPDPSQNRPQIPITWPLAGTLTLDWVTNLMFTFDWSSRNLQPSELPTVFPVEVFDALVLAGSKILHKEPNCVSIEPDKDGVMGSSVVVVGDVHGQLHDVLFLLKDAGLPSENRFFVFNGDYVDRGAWGLETFVLLLAWKVLMPHRVFMLRGNHESKYCTSVYGFEKEVLAKYGEEGKHVYRKCLGCFKELPLALIIAGRVYTAHGGVFRNIPATSSKGAKGKKKREVVLNPEPAPLSLGSMEELSKAGRFVLNPPYEGQNLIPGDVLWSDPSMEPGLSPNKERGIGLLWGPDCTEDFLKKFSLKLIIRSHEGPDAREKRPGLEGMDEGYTIDHEVPSGKLITVFSAPDYPQFQATEERYKNKGAYIVLKSPNFNTPVFQRFEAVLPRPKVNPYYDFEDMIDADEELDHR